MNIQTGIVGNHKLSVRSNEGGIHSSLRKIMKSGGEREPELLYMLKTEVKPGMTCFDVGANIGYVTLMFCELIGPTGKVYAIEPDPSNIELLKINVNQNNYNNQVKIFHQAISNKSGESNFYVGVSSNLGGLTKSKNTKSVPVSVKLDTLNNFCNENCFPDFIKFDVEGSEVEILEGFYNTVLNNNFPCKIVMELHPTTYTKEHNLEVWIRKFLGCGFKTKYIASAGVVQPDLFKEWGYEPKIRCQSNRGIYVDFKEEHMIQACCYENKQWMPGKKRYSPKVARFLMIER